MIGIAFLVGACVTGMTLGAPADLTTDAVKNVTTDTPVAQACLGCWQYKNAADPLYHTLVQQALASAGKNYGIHKIESVREQVVNGVNYDIMFIPVGKVELCDITFHIAASPKLEHPQDIKLTCLAVQN